jgi:hypothetical protein
MTLSRNRRESIKFWFVGTESYTLPFINHIGVTKERELTVKIDIMVSLDASILTKEMPILQST